MIKIEEIPAQRAKEFWDIQYRYLVADSMITTEEEKEYFQSTEYRDTLNSYMLRSPDTLHRIYFVCNDVKIGASQYCIYKSEDGKCFILDFWVFPDYRGNGTGHKCFQALYEYTKKDGAKYYKLSPIKRTVGRYKNPCFRTLSDAESLILDTDQDKILQSGQLFTGDADYHSRIEVAVR